MLDAGAWAVAGAHGLLADAADDAQARGRARAPRQRRAGRRVWAPRAARRRAGRAHAERAARAHAARPAAALRRARAARALCHALRLRALQDGSRTRMRACICNDVLRAQRVCTQRAQMLCLYLCNVKEAYAVLAGML